MKETPAEEIVRLQREIGERQMRLQRLVFGDQSVSVSCGPMTHGFAHEVIGDAEARVLEVLKAYAGKPNTKETRDEIVDALLRLKLE